MTYRALRERYVLTGETSRNEDGKLIRYQAVEWVDLGPAEDMQDAKRRYGGYPVLEREQIHYV